MLVSDKERLEEIKEQVKYLQGDFLRDDLGWLIEQAEQMENLKNAFDDLDSDYIDLVKQNKRYRESIKNALNELWVLNAYENDDSVCAAYKILIEVLESESDV